MDILHRVGITRPRDAVFDALTTVDGLAAWWTEDTRGDGDPGGTLAFRFGDAGGFDVKVLDTEPHERVLWEVIDGPEEWIGTEGSWELRTEGESVLRPRTTCGSATGTDVSASPGVAIATLGRLAGRTGTTPRTDVTLRSPRSARRARRRSRPPSTR